MTRTASQAADTEGGPARVVATTADDRETAAFPFLDREVTLYEPTTGQRFILVQTIGIDDEGADTAEKVELALGFATMLRALFVEPEDRQYVTGALARGIAELDDYFQLARLMAEHWEVEEAPANREERRTRERKPVAKAVPRRRPAAPRR